MEFFGYEDEGQVEYGEMRNKRGLRLQTYCWRVSSPRGVVIGVHGIGSHCRWEFLRHSHFFPEEDGKPPEYFPPTYEGSWVQVMNQAGFVFTGLDLQSYGLSEGVEGTPHYFDDFDELVEDVMQFRDQMAEENPELPICILGESLGGCVCVRVCELEENTKIAGAVFLSPMISLEQMKAHPINRVLLPMADCLSYMVPKARLAKKADNEFFPEDARLFDEDPLTEGNQHVRTRVAVECRRIIEQAREELSKVECPILIFASTSDTLVDPEGSQHLYNDCSSTDKKLVMLDSGKSWHVLIHEPEKDEILVQIIEWLEARAPVQA